MSGLHSDKDENTEGFQVLLSADALVQHNQTPLGWLWMPRESDRHSAFSFLSQVLISYLNKTPVSQDPDNLSPHAMMYERKG